MRKILILVFITPCSFSFTYNYDGYTTFHRAKTKEHTKETGRNNAVPSIIPFVSSSIHDVLHMSQRKEELDAIEIRKNEYSVLPDFTKPHRRWGKKKTEGRDRTEQNMIETPKYKKLSDILLNSRSRITKSPTQKRFSRRKSKNSHVNQSKNNLDINHTGKNEDNVKPWCANYTSSYVIQKKIHMASIDVNLSPIERAINVANTLLNTPPEWCNESNIVYALTLSAKVLASSSSQSSSSSLWKKKQNEFRIVLLDILETLHSMVKNKKLNTRQLANVSWAIAKHYSIGSLILPKEYNQKEKFVYSSDVKGSVTYYEEWDLKKIEQSKHKDSDEARKRIVMETLDDIAESLIESVSLEMDHYHDLKNGRNIRNAIKAGEISMICWAYSIIYPRLSPPGWKLPSRPSSNDDSKKIESRIGNNRNVVLYQTLSTYSHLQEGIDRPTTIIDKLFDVLAQRLIWSEDDTSPMTHQLSWKEISTISWAYAHRGTNMSSSFMTLISQFTKEAIGRLQHSESGKNAAPLARDVSEIAWALGVLQTDNFIFSDVLEEYIDSVSNTFIDNKKERPLENWTTADCVQLAVAMAHGRIDDQVLLENIFNEAVLSFNEELEKKTFTNEKNRNKFQSWELSVLLWVQARLYLTGEISDTFEMYAEMLPKVLLQRLKLSSVGVSEDDFSSIGLGAQETANLCWSLTVLDKYHTTDSVKLINEIFRSTARSCSDGKGIKLEHAHQLWQSYFILDNIPTDDLITDDFLAFLKKSWDQEKSRRKSSSARHKALSQTLSFMGVAHYNEHEEDIDVAVVLKTDSKWLHTASVMCDVDECQTKVAVEFDGPAHFTRQINKDDPPRALGHTVLKYKLLKKQGWTVVRVPFYEFDRIPFWASMERQRYLQRKLKTHANIKFSGVDISEYKAPTSNKISRFD